MPIDVKKTIYKELIAHENGRRAIAEARKEAIEVTKIRDEVYKPIQQAQQRAEEEATRQDYSRRREAGLKEVQAKIDQEKQQLEERVERELRARRELLRSHWSERAAALRDESAAARRRHHDQLDADYRQGVDDLYSEFANRTYNQARLQTEAPGYLDNHDLTVGRERFGIFGRRGRNTDPHAQGDELLEEDMEDAKYEPFLDNHDVKIFHSDPNTYYEEKNEARYEQQADVARDQQLYDALKVDCKALTDTMERMCQMREVVERDLYQIDQESKLAEGDRYRIPPKALPGELEINPMHDRRERHTLLRRRVDDLQYSINKADERKRAAEAQMLSLARNIAVGKEQSKQMASDLLVVNGAQGMLPVVVGHSLARVNGLNVHTAYPRQFLAAVTAQSHYISLKELSKEVQRAFKARNEHDQEMWMHHEENVGVKGEFDLLNTCVCCRQLAIHLTS